MRQQNVFFKTIKQLFVVDLICRVNLKTLCGDLPRRTFECQFCDSHLAHHKLKRSAKRKHCTKSKKRSVFHLYFTHRLQKETLEQLTLFILRCMYRVETQLIRFIVVWSCLIVVLRLLRDRSKSLVIIIIIISRHSNRTIWWQRFSIPAAATLPRRTRSASTSDGRLQLMRVAGALPSRWPVAWRGHVTDSGATAAATRMAPRLT